MPHLRRVQAVSRSVRGYAEASQYKPARHAPRHARSLLNFEGGKAARSGKDEFAL